MISERRFPFSSVREKGLFFSPVKEEIIIFKRNISNLQTKKVKRKGEIISILMLERNERKLEYTQILSYDSSKLQRAKHGKLVIIYQYVNITLFV